MTLHLYFARRFALSLLLVGGAFFGVLVLLDLVEQLRRFEDDAATPGDFAILTLLSVPETLYAILPLIVILATLSLFLALARSSELVVARASGRSALRSLTAPVAVAMALGVAAVCVLNPMVAATSQRYEAVAERLSNGAVSTLSLSPDGLWLRQGDAGGQMVIRAARANLDGTVLYGVSFIGFGPGGAPDRRVEAAQARLVPGAWELTDAKEWRLSDPNPEATATRAPAMTLASNLTASRILDSFATPAAVPIWELPRFIAQLERAGFSARKHRVWMQMELALPLLLAAMVLVGAGFTMRHTRFGRTGIMVLSALGLGFGLFVIRNFAQILGENGQLPIALAAWGPPVAAILLPIGLLLHWEDG